ncbi:hypothetical protein ACE6H2_000645 [Prunus campanulata]
MNSPAVLPSHQQNDLEAGTYKDAPIQRINRWRQAMIVLCASRRFRQTLYLEIKEQASSNVDPAFQTEAGEPVKGHIAEHRNPVSTAADKAEHRHPVSTTVGKAEHRNPVSMATDKAEHRNPVNTAKAKATKP